MYVFAKYMNKLKMSYLSPDMVSTNKFMRLFWDKKWYFDFSMGRSRGHYSPNTIITEVCIEEFTNQYLHRNYVFCSRLLWWCRNSGREYNFVRSFIEKIALIEGLINHEFLQDSKMIYSRKKDTNKYLGSGMTMTLLEIIICSDMIYPDKYVLIKYIINLGAKVNMFVVISAFANQIHPNILNLLLNNFDPNERDDVGNTILHRFPYGRHIENEEFTYHIYHYNEGSICRSEMFQKFINNCKSNNNIKNNKKTTPLKMAIYNGNTLIILSYLINNIGITEINDVKMSRVSQNLATFEVIMDNGIIHKMNHNIGTEEEYEKTISQYKSIVIRKILPMPIAEEIEYYIHISHCGVL